MSEVKDQLIRQLDEARRVMRSLVSQIDSQQQIYPPWRVKELLAHIAGWDDAAIASLHAHARGEALATPASRGIDYYNVQTVEERSGLDEEHIRKEWEASRELFKQAITMLPDEKVAMKFVFPWGYKGTVAQIVAIFAHHEADHAHEIAKKLKLPGW